MKKKYSHYIKIKLKEFDIEKAELYSDFYSEVENTEFRALLSIFHFEINSCFKEINDRLESRYLHADNSRHFMDLLNNINDIINELKDSEFRFEFIKPYQIIINECNLFLEYYRGTTIPETFKRISIIEISGIFEIGDVISKRYGEDIITFNLKPIGSGSYANVYKYKDTFYNKLFAVKRAKKGLQKKEYERFRNEFSEMKKLSSPYVIEVYNFNEEKNEYYMEFADYTLDKFIKDNNTKIKIYERRSIIKQILRAFEYINNKNILHRDVSTRNILLKKYDDLHIVKISDFGLVKSENSVLTSLNTEVKGHFNDPNLTVIGFKNYSLIHETYAIIRIIYFVITGKYKIEDKINNSFMSFIKKGLSSNENERFKNVREISDEFCKLDLK